MIIHLPSGVKDDHKLWTWDLATREDGDRNLVMILFCGTNLNGFLFFLLFHCHSLKFVIIDPSPFRDTFSYIFYCPFSHKRIYPQKTKKGVYYPCKTRSTGITISSFWRVDGNIRDWKKKEGENQLGLSVVSPRYVHCKLFREFI